MTPEPSVPTPSALTKGRAKPDLTDVPGRTVISLQGVGSPADPGFAASVGALYGVAYTLRFSRKAAGRPAFKVGPLEGEWHAGGGSPRGEHLPPPDQWRWTLRIGVPEDLTEGELAAAVETVASKRKAKPEERARVHRIEMARLDGARFARILHVGPYATEPASFEKIAGLLAEEGLRREPWHLEVYLSDPGRTAPEKLKTVLLARVR
jgi:hypothetical protein